MRQIQSLSLSTEQKLHIVLSVLSDKKAEDILALDLRELGYVLCDYFVLATGESDRQNQAIAEELLQRLKDSGAPTHLYHTEGYEPGRWILVDLGDIIVHVLLPEVRAYYRLEELWGDAKVISHV